MEVNENPLSQKSIEHIKGLMGTILFKDANLSNFPEPTQRQSNNNDAIPDNFDGRVEWKDCIQPIRD